jgi:hypothetical protein
MNVTLSNRATLGHLRGIHYAGIGAHVMHRWTVQASSRKFHDSFRGRKWDDTCHRLHAMKDWLTTELIIVKHNNVSKPFNLERHNVSR